MRPTHDDLLDALELGSLVIPGVPGHTEMLDVPGLVARTARLASPFINLAACARLEAADAAAALDRLVAIYAERRLPLGFMLGPRSRPADLAARLEARGFTLLTGADGFVLEDLAYPIDAPDDVAIREIRAGDDTSSVDLAKALSFDMPVAVARGIDEMLLACGPDRARLYVAEIGGEPAAFGQSLYARDARIVLLGGGGVVPRFRGRGLFRALVRHRLRDALADGMRAATIQSWHGTSAPLMPRMGFRKVCDLALYQRLPG